MKFYDKNGTEINVGDHIVPDEGMELFITAQGNIPEYDEEIMMGEQVENISTFSILTQDNLSLQWTKKE